MNKASHVYPFTVKSNISVTITKGKYLNFFPGRQIYTENTNHLYLQIRFL